jgi:hypothetical protein
MFQINFQTHLGIPLILLGKQIALPHREHPEKSGIQRFDQEIRVQLESTGRQFETRGVEVLGEFGGRREGENGVRQVRGLDVVDEGNNHFEDFGLEQVQRKRA